MADRPNELSRFISQKQREATASNQDDHRPTFQAQMDDIAKECDELYERGLTLIAEISAEDLERCRKLCVHRQGNTFGVNDLHNALIKKQWVIVPKYFVYIEEMEKLKELLQ